MMPKTEEIKRKAYELYMKKQARHSDSALSDTLPEFGEVLEDGFAEDAKISLMSNSAKDAAELYKKYCETERVHSGFSVSDIIRDIKEHLGIVLVAEAGHGKSFTAFAIAREAMKDKDMTVIILSPSTIWKRKFGAINYVKVGTSAFNPIVTSEETEVEVVPFLREAIHINLDKKYDYVKSAWLEDLLRSKQHLLFEIKYRNGRRIKAFESVILQAIYEAQEKQVEQNPDYQHHYLIILEEIQNSFGTYSMNSDDSLDLMTIFTQSRSDAQIHYIGVGQRLNDISTKVIERLRPFIGLTLGENSLRKIKSQLPEDLKDRVQQLPKRHWLYLDGKENPEIVIPEYKPEGSPIQLLPFETSNSELVSSPSLIQKVSVCIRGKFRKRLSLRVESE